jgi:excisionase family DNA binding protein
MSYKNLFTTSEAAKYLGISVSSLLKWEGVGKITSVRTPSSNQKFFPKEQLDRARWRLDRLDYDYFKRF